MQWRESPLANVLLIRLGQPLARRRRFDVASPPLGLMSLVAWARRERPGRDRFRLVDERIVNPENEYYRRLIRDFKPDVIGLSALSIEIVRLRELAPLLRQLAPNVPLVLGGPHPSAVGSKVFQDLPVTHTVMGEGEKAFIALLDQFDRGLAEPEQPVSGLVYRRPDGTISETPYNQDLVDVESLPRPAWDLLNLDEYAAMGRMAQMYHGKYAALFTSRGCPYRCTYCHDIHTKKFRAQSPRKVVDEIQFLIETYGVNDFEVYDDIFNADYDRTLGICDEIKRRGLETRFSFPNGIRGDRMDATLLQALAEVGTYQMCFAVETASPRLQKQIRKHIKLPEIEENIATSAKLGIFTCGFFMLGFPTETRAEMESTVEFSLRSALHVAFFFTVIPYDGTQMAKENPKEVEAFGWSAPTISFEAPDQGPGRLPVVRSEGNHHFATNGMSELTPEELTAFRRNAYLRFYLNPIRALRIVRNLRMGPRAMASSALEFKRLVGSLA